MRRLIAEGSRLSGEFYSIMIAMTKKKPGDEPGFSLCGNLQSHLRRVALLRPLLRAG